ncbi:MAG: hypothetical protein AAFY28_15835 [Actinomycetota bacterium]
MPGGDDDDLWAATRPDGVGPTQPTPDATDGAGHDDRANPEPTRVQPAIRMGLGTPGGGSTQTHGGTSSGDARPPWLIPAAIGLAVVLIGGLFVAFAGGGDGDDNTAPLDASTSTSLTTTTALESAVAATATTDDDASDDDGVGANGGSTTVNSTATTADATTAPTEPPASNDDGSTGGGDTGTGGDTGGGEGGDTADAPTDAGTDTTAPSETTSASTTPPATPAPDDSDEPAVTPPDPGFAAYGEERLAVESSCRELPRGPEGDEVSSFLVRSSTDGRVVVEQRVAGDQVTMDVRYPDTGEVVAANGLQVTDGATLGQITRNGASLDVAVTAPPGGVEECLDFIELVPSNDVDARGYTAGILDVCTVDTPSGRALSGIATDNTSFTAVPTGETTRLTIVVPTLGGTLVDDDALADSDETIVFYDGMLTGAGEPQTAYLEVELESPRVCTASEAP